MDEMKKMVLLGFLILFLAIIALWGCATVPKGPLQTDEVRLTDLRIIELGDKGKKEKFYRAIIKYQRGERIKPEDIYLVCTTWYWDKKT